LVGGCGLEELSLYASPILVRWLFETRMPSLRIVQVYLAEEYPLRQLAENKSLKNLTHLTLHPKACDPACQRRFLRLGDVRHL
jgi:hypothetical protein